MQPRMRTKVQSINNKLHFEDKPMAMELAEMADSGNGACKMAFILPVSAPVLPWTSPAHNQKDKSTTHHDRMLLLAFSFFLFILSTQKKKNKQTVDW